MTTDRPVADREPLSAWLRTRIEALPEMVGEPNDGGWSLVRRSDVLAALSQPAVPVAHDLPMDPLDESLARRARRKAALDQPAVPVAGAEEELREALAREERDHARTMEERDGAQKWADRLAAALGGPDIGEYSNLNNPWQNALDEPLRAAQPEDDGLARCPDCEHRQTEHATPGAECVHAVGEALTGLVEACDRADIEDRLPDGVARALAIVHGFVPPEATTQPERRDP